MRYGADVGLITIVALWCFLGVSGLRAASGQASLVPASLRCEGLEDPRGLGTRRPQLSWILEPTRPEVRDARPSAHRILAAYDRRSLDDDAGPLWDSGKVRSDQSIHIRYDGKPLKSGDRVYWKLRVWDEADRPSAWSEVATWSMGLLEPGDWDAKWIGDPTPAPERRAARNGYHSELADSADAVKTIVIELPEAASLDAVRLYPARPYDWVEDVPGFLYPLRFRIDVSTTSDFTEYETVVDRTAEDVASPGDEPQTHAFEPVTGRHVRLVVTRMRHRREGEYGVALAEMKALSGDRNLAYGAMVSASDSIETGEWSAGNLVDDDLRSHGPKGAEAQPSPMLRKEFQLDTGRGAVSRATAYVTALGLYELSINGERIGDRALAPEWTDYRQRVQYQTFDVTDVIGPGANAIGVILGDGWYAGRIGLTGIVPDGPTRGIYGRRPALLMQLEIEFADGSRETIVSDETWRSTLDGPVRAADLLDGVVWDARRETPGWDRTKFDDAAWSAVRVDSPPGVELVAQANEPIRVIEELRPVAVTEPKPGVYVFDLGQNFAGRCRLLIEGAKAGDTVTLRHAEMLNPDGTIYTANLRSAAQTDRYICRGGGLETFEPRFTYHGFRYVEVAGLAGKPEFDRLTGLVLSSAAPETGSFECSNPLLDQLMSNILWTLRSNTHSIPTDCPQRDERLGWTGDILAFAQTACFNLDMEPFFRKWLGDMRDAQTDDGRFPDFAPHPFGPEVRFSGVPAWGDAGVFVPWVAYLNYGDQRFIERNYDAARRWVDWIRSKNPDLLWTNDRNNDYGDWLNADTLVLEGWPKSGAQVPKEVFATAFFARSTQLVANMAAVLNREADERKYGELAEEIRRTFVSAYVNEAGRIKGDTQAGYALALAFDLLPEELQGAAAQRMVERFEPYDGHISTGFHTTVPLMLELTKRGSNDEAYRLINKRTVPSWGYQIEQGATTTWERWDGYVEGRGFQNPGMNSFSHYALGSVGEWMYRTILGLNPDESEPGWKRAIIQPRPGGDLSWARGHYDSVHGRYAVAWKLDDESISLTVTVPPNASAIVYVPTSDPSSVTEGGRPAGEAEGVRSVGADDGAAVLEVGSGVYEFAAPR